jgi:hypothetical protein
LKKEQLKQLEDDLWAAADNLRANSDLKASEYSTPVLGLIFLKFADINCRCYEEASSVNTRHSRAEPTPKGKNYRLTRTAETQRLPFDLLFTTPPAAVALIIELALLCQPRMYARPVLTVIIGCGEIVRSIAIKITRDQASHGGAGISV